MNTRPAYDASGLPEIVRARVIAKANSEWCYVTVDGRSFYVSESQARKLHAAHGGSLYPPVTP